MVHLTRIAVVVLLHDSRDHLDGCFSSLAACDRTGIDLEVIAVDNGSTDGTPGLVRQRFPWVRLLENGANLGFSAGNNVGIQDALARDVSYVCVLNHDTSVEPAFLREALAAATAPDVAAVQSLLLLDPERHLVNSAGNEIQFLGFGHCGHYREPAAAWVGAPPREITYPSGAATLYRASALREVGLFDENLFLYQEDLDLGWRLRLAGYRCLVAPASRVFHAYDFARHPDKYFHLERNRFFVLLKLLGARSLLVLLPLMLAAELPLCTVAAAQGWLRPKLRSYGALLRPHTIGTLLRERRRTQRLRRVPDTAILHRFTDQIAHVDAGGPALGAVSRSPFRAAWRLARLLLGVPVTA